MGQAIRVEQQDKKGKATTSINGSDTDAPPLSIVKLTKSIRKKLASPSLTSNPSIFKVPEKFQKVNPNAYTPELVSIGPFHRENKILWSMQEHKLCYANTFISRSEKDLQEYVECMWKIRNEARDCYSVRFDKLKDDKFVEMMLLDGLFIIVLFQKSAGVIDKGENDPIFTNSWTISSLIRDLVLLENQIPMLVLRALLEKATSSPGEAYSKFLKLTLEIFKDLLTPMDPSEVHHQNDVIIMDSNHLLDLVRRTLFYPPTLSPITNTNKSIYIKMTEWTRKEIKSTLLLPCATELHRAGLTFKKASWKGSFLDINFSNGVLKIPTISILYQTEVLFRNLIAYEQSTDGNTMHTICYANLMDNLIDSPEDVKFLCDAGIIKNYLGDHQGVSSLFNRLLCEVSTGDHFYSALYGQVNEYYNAPQHAWRASLKREYFKSPWTIISLIAAFILLLLTIIQTIYTVRSFYVAEGYQSIFP